MGKFTLFGVLLVVVSPAQAPAQPSPPEAEAEAEAEADRAWAVGVSPDDRRKATALFEEGNSSFEERHYAAALKPYVKALEHWDHPAIAFNAAVCSINLEQPVKAYEYLQRAQRFGEAPLGPKLHADAATYERLLRARLARLVVRCEQDGARINLDGDAVITCPGEATQMLLPGRHNVVGRMAGHATLIRELDLEAGSDTVETFTLVPIEENVRIVRRFKPWIPAAVAGSGAALGFLGLGLHSMSRSHLDDYDRDIDLLCPQGCPEEEIPDAVRGLASRARVEGVAAYASYTIGAAALVAAGVLLVINEPRRVPVEEQHEAIPFPVVVHPMLGPDGAGVAVSAPW